MAQARADAGNSGANSDVAVIGGGAAGLLAGLAARRGGAHVVVYERNARCGRKLEITGGGRCNFSNTLNPREFVRRFGDPHAVHLGHALRAFGREALVSLLAAHGVAACEEASGRLFTASGRARDVVQALLEELTSVGAAVALSSRVLALRRAEPAGFELDLVCGAQHETHRARTVVLCTGGLSYPETGSSGDGFAWLRAFGHTLRDLRPGLVGLAVSESWAKALSGLSWPDAAVRLREASVAQTSERGEILFTHFGLSGPAILDLSNAFSRAGVAHAVLELDLFPDLPEAALDAQLRERLQAGRGRQVQRALAGLLPERLALACLTLAGLADTHPARLPGEGRRALARLLKRLPLTVTGTRGIAHGEVTVGGVAWEEVAPATLESRLVPGLFLAGEVLDVAGRCGGFNLQAAFSTGFLAGQSAARGIADS